MSTVFVRPIKGALVRNPQTMTPLPEDGALVSLDGSEGKFWRRRISDGSVVVDNNVAMPAAAPPETTESATRTERGGRNR